ncbi:hypothetical protein LCGC14_0364100 [marine sediment metagenome]|uniref:Uncharacterized protein n=1 Tax=marine sediment metagenome TaxID=412755 RepID=A0A0F9VUC6_9ZZZZ
MAEEDGGTPEPKTFSEDQVAELVAVGKKEGASESWRHFQSEADKQISAAKNEGSTREAELAKTIDTMKAAQIETLPVEERTRAMVEELYKDRGGVKSSSPAPDSKATNDSPGVSNEEAEKQVRETIGNHLKEMGLDPSKVNWGTSLDGNENLKALLGSIVDQAKAGQSSAGDDANKDDDKSGKSGQNNVDTSRGAGTSRDITQMKPIDLMTSGGKWEAIRGMEE